MIIRLSRVTGLHKRFQTVAVAVIACGCIMARPAEAQKLAPLSGDAAPTFAATLSNTTPLAFGMDAEDAARALGMPLNYIGGRPGDEIYLVFRTRGGTGFFNRRDRLYLQFRHGRLAGWKGDWGRNWMWQ